MGGGHENVAMKAVIAGYGMCTQVLGNQNNNDFCMDLIRLPKPVPFWVISFRKTWECL